MPNILLEYSRDRALEGMKRLSQSRNNAQLWMCLVVKVESDAVKNNIAKEPAMLGPRVKGNRKQSDDKPRQCIKKQRQGYSFWPLLMSMSEAFSISFTL